jgi:hypothetical protein
MKVMKGWGPACPLLSVRPEFIEGLLESKERFDGLNANGIGVGERNRRSPRTHAREGSAYLHHPIAYMTSITSITLP